MKHNLKFVSPPYLTPDWLMNLNSRAIRNSQIPKREILEDSLYYPSSGLDAKPIRHFGGAVHSFVHVDYGVAEEKFLAELKKPGLRGYQVMGSLDGADEFGVRSWENPGFEYCPNYIQKPFAYWVVWKRQKGFTDEHGPKRLSLLHLSAEGVTAYKKLYRQQGIAPKFLAIIQPGHGFGCNWTDYTQAGSPLHQTVMFRRAVAKPSFLVNGGWCGDHESREHYRGFQCWPEFPKQVAFFTGYKCSFGVWQRKPRRQPSKNVNKSVRPKAKNPRRLQIKNCRTAG